MIIYETLTLFLQNLDILVHETPGFVLEEFERI